MLDDAVPGSVIYARRSVFLGFKIYEHYGIFADNNEVIHFDNSGKSVHKISLEDFISDSGISNCFVKHFPETRKGLELVLKNKLKKNNVDNELNELFNHGYQFFSDAQTLARAEELLRKSKINPREYSVFFSNCEHFAVYCKTGVENCDQWRHFFKVILS